MCERIKLHVWSLKCLIGYTVVCARINVFSFCAIRMIIRRQGRMEETRRESESVQSSLEWYHAEWVNGMCCHIFSPFTGDFVRFVITRFLMLFDYEGSVFFFILSLSLYRPRSSPALSMCWNPCWVFVLADHTLIIKIVTVVLFFIKMIMSIFAFLFHVFYTR